MPCQDTGAVKFTFKAEVTHPLELTALMGGVRLSGENGKTSYEQTVPIPAYLVAIAVGAIVSRPLGKMYVIQYHFIIKFHSDEVKLLLC